MRIFNQKILVTGGAGFIGSNLVKTLVEKGSNVRIADNLSRGKIKNMSSVSEKIEFMKIDLTKKSSCLSACKDMDIVFHLAANVGGIEYLKKENVRGCTPSILMNTYMLEAAVKSKVERFIFTSSACVYKEDYPDKKKPFYLEEDDAYPAFPHTTYGWTKLLGEIQCEAYAKDYNLKTSIVRLFNVFGENESLASNWSHVIPSLLSKAIMYPKKPFIVFGNGEQIRAFLYVQDAVKALLLIAENFSYPDPLNVGSDNWITIKDLAKKIIKLSNKDIEIRYDKTKPLGSNAYYANYQKIHKILGWAPETSLDEGLKRTYEWENRELSHE